jgi:uncharacterized protein
MKIEQSFEVGLPPAEVWAALIDVERIAPCLPGAEIDRCDEEGVYHGIFTVKIGPMTVKYRGTLKMEALDEAARTARMEAHGLDMRGQGGANAKILSTLADSNGGTRVEVVTDLTLSGKVARFGRGGMVEDVSRQLMGEFSACLEKQLSSTPTSTADAPAAEPVKGIRVGLKALWARIRRLFRGGS